MPHGRCQMAVCLLSMRYAARLVAREMRCLLAPPDFGLPGCKCSGVLAALAGAGAGAGFMLYY